MEVKITSNVENKLFNRKEIKFEVMQDGSTATRSDVTKDICKKLNLHPDSTIIVRIDQGYGAKQSRGFAHSYSSKEELEKYESKKLVARIAKKFAKSKEASATATPAEEKPEEGIKE